MRIRYACASIEIDLFLGNGSKNPETYFFLRGLSVVVVSLEAADVTVIDETAVTVGISADDADGLAYFDCFFFLSLALRLFSSCCQIARRWLHSLDPGRKWENDFSKSNLNVCEIGLAYVSSSSFSSYFGCCFLTSGGTPHDSG